MSKAQQLKQQRLAAVLRYVRCPRTGWLVPVPPGQRLAPGQRAQLIICQN